MHIPTGDDDPPSEEMRDFYYALGQLFHAFSDLEFFLACMVHNVADPPARLSVHTEVVLALTAGMRMSPLKDTIKRLLRVTKAPKRRTEFMDAMFQQLSEIQYFRDRLAHNFTYKEPTQKENEWTNEDFATVREWDRSQFLKFKTETLLFAARDLQTIGNRASGLFSYYRKRPVRPLDTTPISWLYKPSMLTRHHRKSFGNPKRPARPRRASRKKS